MKKRSAIILVASILLFLAGKSFAAIAANTVWELRATGDDLNGAGFNPGNTSMLTNLAATVATSTAPLVSSSSYSFVAGDVGYHVFIKSGTNWTPGWYEISSVIGSSATLKAAIGDVVGPSSGNYPNTINTVGGAATVASPTGGTWTIDYSQNATARFSYTDLSQVTTTLLSSVANPFTKACVANVIGISTGAVGTWTTGYYEITSVTLTTATVDRTTGGTGGTGGTGRVGGAFLNISSAANNVALSNRLYIAPGTYTIPGTITKTGGSFNQISTSFIGYSTKRTDRCLNGTRPILRATGLFTAILITGSNYVFENIDLDGNSVGGLGIALNGSYVNGIMNSIARGWTLGAIQLNNTGGFAMRNEITGNAGVTTGALYGPLNSITMSENYIHDNTTAGIIMAGAGDVVKNIISNNTGAASDGITSTGYGSPNIKGNTIYKNGRDGINITNYDIHANIAKNIITNNSRYGINQITSVGQKNNWNGNAFFSNTSGSYNNYIPGPDDVTLTASPFVDAANNNFSLNSKAGGGAACRQVGYVNIFTTSMPDYTDIGAVQSKGIVGGSYGVSQ